MIDNFDKQVDNHVGRIIYLTQGWRFFSGAAYNTRVRAMIKEVRTVLDTLEALMEEDIPNKPSQGYYRFDPTGAND